MNQYESFLQSCKQLIEEIEDITPKMRLTGNNYNRTRKEVNQNPPDKSWTYGHFESKDPKEVEKMLGIFSFPMREDYIAVQIYADRYDYKTNSVTVQACKHIGPYHIGPAKHYTLTFEQFKAAVTNEGKEVQSKHSRNLESVYRGPRERQKGSYR